jgi:hypothetical protein
MGCHGDGGQNGAARGVQHAHRIAAQIRHEDAPRARAGRVDSCVPYLASAVTSRHAW